MSERAFLRALARRHVEIGRPVPWPPAAAPCRHCGRITRAWDADLEPVCALGTGCEPDRYRRGAA